MASSVDDGKETSVYLRQLVLLSQTHTISGSTHQLLEDLRIAFLHNVITWPWGVWSP